MTSEQEAALPNWFDPVSWQDRIAQLKGSRAWFCTWVIHRVEALVSVGRQNRLEGLQRALLLRIAREHRLPSDQEDVDIQLVAGLRQDLIDAGLIEETSPEQWDLTETGTKALEGGTFLLSRHDRRVFHFLLREGEPLPALFLQVSSPLASSPRMQFSFEPDWLRAWIALPPEQKRILNFPEEITAVETLTPDGAADWRRVVLGSSSEGCFLLVELPGKEAGTSLHGFFIEPSDPAKGLGQPAFILGPGWQQFLPELDQQSSDSSQSHQPVKLIYPRNPVR